MKGRRDTGIQQPVYINEVQFYLQNICGYKIFLFLNANEINFKTFQKPGVGSRDQRTSGEVKALGGEKT